MIWQALDWVTMRAADVHRAMERRRVTRELANLPQYSFTDDYVSRHIDNWTRLLAPWQGAAGVRMLELGSYEGRSAVWFLQNVLTGEGAGLVCVDVFYRPRWELRFDHNIRVSGKGGRVTKVKGQAAEFLAAAPESFDIIYVDASHEARDVLLDGMLSWRRLTPGGMLIFDDYLWEQERSATRRPQLAIDLFLENFAGQYDLVLKEYQVAIRRVR